MYTPMLDFAWMNEEYQELRIDLVGMLPAGQSDCAVHPRGNRSSGACLSVCVSDLAA
eukprot:COSAG02_NODE_65157_length_258_cov_1.622642_1_plen_56_part_10